MADYNLPDNIQKLIDDTVANFKEALTVEISKSFNFEQMQKDIDNAVWDIRNYIWDNSQFSEFYSNEEITEMAKKIVPGADLDFNYRGMDREDRIAAEVRKHEKAHRDTIVLECSVASGNVVQGIEGSDAYCTGVLCFFDPQSQIRTFAGRADFLWREDGSAELVDGDDVLFEGFPYSIKEMNSAIEKALAGTERDFEIMSFETPDAPGLDDVIAGADAAAEQRNASAAAPGRDSSERDEDAR